MKSAFFTEYVDPFDGTKTDFILKAEHLGRYLFAKKMIEKENLSVVYDIACGNGYGTRILSEGKMVYGFDQMQNQNTHNAIFQTIDLNTEDFTQSVNRLHIPKPDCIVSFETLEHLKEPGKILQSFHRLLATNGRLVLSVPNAVFEPKKKGRSRNVFHLHLFYKQDILTLLQQNGFGIEVVLGQSIPNILMHKTKWLLPILNRIFLINTKALVIGTKLTALPSKIYPDFSYSIVIVARKT